MKSRTSFCNGAIVKKGLLRGAPLWGMYLLIWLLCLPLTLISDSYLEHTAIRIQDYIQNLTIAASSVVPFFYGLASAFLLFSYLYRSRSANFFGALPLTRDNLFFSNYITGLLYALIPHVLTALFTCVAVLPTSSALVIDVMHWLLYSLLGYVFYYSFAVLCAMLVGHVVALPLLYGVLNFTVAVVELIVRELLSAFVYGVDFTAEMTLYAFSPLVYQFSDGLSSNAVWTRAPDQLGGVTEEVVAYELRNQSSMWILLAVGVIFALLAWLLYKKRRLESAGDVIAVNRLKPVFLCCFTLGCSLVIGWVLTAMLVSGSMTNNFLPVLLCMLTGAVLGYFAGEMMLQKSLRVFRKRNWLRCGVSCVVVTAALLCCRLDLFGIAGYVPNLDDVQSVRLSYSSAEVEDSRFIGLVIGLHQDLVDRQAETERQNRYADRTPTVRISYTLKNGNTVARRYSIPVNEDTATDPNSLIRQYEAIYNDPDFIVMRELPGDLSQNNITHGYIYLPNWNQEVYLTAQQTYELVHTALIPDMREQRIGVTLYTDDYYETESAKEMVTVGPAAVAEPYYGFDLQIFFRDGSSCYIGLDQDAVKTVQMLIDMGLVPAEYFSSAEQE